MLATPLSISMAAGVSANTSEMRAPLHPRTRQKSCVLGSVCVAALRKRRRSAALRYFGRRLARRGSHRRGRAPASPPRLKQNGRFCFKRPFARRSRPDHSPGCHRYFPSTQVAGVKNAVDLRSGRTLWLGSIGFTPRQRLGGDRRHRRQHVMAARAPWILILSVPDLSRGT
jgi:hypothetical protein